MEESFKTFGWNKNPFTLKIEPSLLTGYSEQILATKRHIAEKHKISLIVGPTGSGKTTLLKWLESDTPSNKLYLSKPPKNPEEFVQIFTDTFGLSFWERLSGKRPSLYSLSNYINRKIGKNHLVFMVDEAHETTKDVLEWLRVLTDQIDNMSLLIAGLPQLEDRIKTNLETLNQRITSRIILTALTESETKELIKKRVESAGGFDTKPFTEQAINSIYQKTGGFPREILKMCDKLIAKAVEQKSEIIEAKMVDEYREFYSEANDLPQAQFETPTVTFSPRPPSDTQLKNLPYKQRKILEVLSKQDWLTPNAIVESLESHSYKSIGHATRSVNNILKRLMLDGYVQRESRGKAFMYSLTPKVKTLFVQS